MYLTNTFIFFASGIDTFDQRRSLTILSKNLLVFICNFKGNIVTFLDIDYACISATTLSLRGDNSENNQYLTFNSTLDFPVSH